MPTAIDTSVLILAQRSHNLADLLAKDPGPFYIPAHAAAEYLAGSHLAASAITRANVRQFYDDYLRGLVDDFGEPEAAQLAALNAELRRKGQTMGFYDAAIAATAMARGDRVLALDNDFDRLENVTVIHP